VTSTWPFFESLEPVEWRAGIALLTSFVLTLAAGEWFLRFLARRRILEHTERGDSERLDVLHASKKHTPTLGGLVFMGAVLCSALLWTRPGDRLVLLLAAYTAALGALGLADDLKKLRTKKGIKARVKFRVQVAVSILAGAYLYFFPLQVHDGAGSTGLGTGFSFTLLGGGVLALGPLYIALVAFVTTSASNAVNLTDGLDGLATGCSLLVAAALTVVAMAVGQAETSAQLQTLHVEGAHEVAVFLGALLGGGLGFLWFNCHPARIFMGDTGALSLGGALGLAAVLLKQELFLVIVGGVLVAETLSVILQVGSFKLRKKRIFLIAPLHHHFQFKGWPETKVTLRFWLAGALFALVSLWTFALSSG